MNGRLFTALMSLFLILLAQAGHAQLVATPNPASVSNSTIDVGEISYLSTVVSGGTGLGTYSGNWTYAQESGNTVSGYIAESPVLGTGELGLVVNAVSDTQLSLSYNGISTPITPSSGNIEGAWDFNAFANDTGTPQNIILTSQSDVTINPQLTGAPNGILQNPTYDVGQAFQLSCSAGSLTGGTPSGGRYQIKALLYNSITSTLVPGFDTLTTGGSSGACTTFTSLSGRGVAPGTYFAQAEAYDSATTPETAFGSNTVTFNVLADPTVTQFQLVGSNTAFGLGNTISYNVIVDGGVGPFTVNLVTESGVVNSLTGVAADTPTILSASIPTAADTTYNVIATDTGSADSGASTYYVFNSISNTITVSSGLGAAAMSVSNATIDVGQVSFISQSVAGGTAPYNAFSYFLSPNGITVGYASNCGAPLTCNITGLKPLGSNTVFSELIEPASPTQMTVVFVSGGGVSRTLTVNTVAVSGATIYGTWAFNAMVSDSESTPSTITTPGGSVKVNPSISFSGFSATNTSLLDGQTTTYFITISGGTGPYTANLIYTGNKMVVNTIQTSNTGTVEFGAITPPAGTDTYYVSVIDHGTSSAYTTNSATSEVTVSGASTTSTLGGGGTGTSGSSSTTTQKSSTTLKALSTSTVRASTTTVLQTFNSSVTVSSNSPATAVFADVGTTLVLFTNASQAQHPVVTVTNDTLNSSISAPTGLVAITLLNLAVTGSSKVTVNATMAYPCAVPSSSITPYILLNGSWVKITPFTVNATLCTVMFSIPDDPILGIFKPMPLTTMASPTITIPGQVGGSGTAEIAIVIAVVLVALVLLYYKFKPKKPAITRPQGSKSYNKQPTAPRRSTDSSYSDY